MPSTERRDEFQEIRFHPDVDLEVYDDPKHLVYRELWCYATARFKDPQGKTISVDFTKPVTPHPAFDGWVVLTTLPSERMPRSKSHETLHDPITRINRMADGRHPDDDGGRARRWWRCIWDLSL